MHQPRGDFPAVVEEGRAILQYAPKGLIGVLTPQANTTVEPEIGILCPPGFGTIAARLTSGKPTIEERLVDYIESIDRTLDQFANAPVAAVAFACTGASYLIEPARGAEANAAIARARGYPFITAADAVHDALTVLGGARIGIVSPYSGALHEACLAYWPKRGVKIAKVAQIASAGDAFHPIYALGASASLSGAESLGADVDVVAMLGTGLPTLPTIRRMADSDIPVISPNLCLMWRAVLAIEGTTPSAENLRPWIAAEGWRQRLAERLGS